jgi:hypothetical protein
MAYANKVLQMQRLAEAQRADASPAPTTKPEESVAEVTPAQKSAPAKKRSRKAKK